MPPDYQCLAIGDSFTHAVDIPPPKPNFYPARVEAALRSKGCAVEFVNHGISGNTTAEILTRARMLTTKRGPALAVVYAGCNDWNRRTVVEAEPAPTVLKFKVEATKGKSYLPGTSILVGKQKGVIRSMEDDLIMLASPLAAAPATGDRVIQDTAQNLYEIGTQLRTRGFEYILIGKQHFLNFAKAGDIPTKPHPLGLEIRTAQQAAANRLGAPVADFFGFMRERLLTGVDQAGTAAWHVKEGDTHLNDYGQSLLAECVVASLPEEWLSRLGG